MLIEMVRLLTARNDLELPKLQVSNAFNVSFSLCKLLFRNFPSQLSETFICFLIASQLQHAEERYNIKLSYS